MAYVKIPAFIVTLAGMLLFRGLTMIVLEGQSIAPFPGGFQKLSSGFIPDFGNTGTNLIAILAGIVFTVIFLINELRERKSHKNTTSKFCQTACSS